MATFSLSKFHSLKVKNTIKFKKKKKTKKSNTTCRKYGVYLVYTTFMKASGEQLMIANACWFMYIVMLIRVCQ